MFSMYPGTGMGANGMGSGSVGNLSPDKLAMLMKLISQSGSGGGAPGMGAPPPSAPTGMPLPPPPMMQGGMQPPMGAPPPPPMMQPPMQPANPFSGLLAGVNRAVNGGQPQTVAGGAQTDQNAQLIAALSKMQSGVSPMASTGGNPGLMTMLKNMLAGYRPGGMAAPPMLGGLDQQAAGNMAGGAAI